MPVLPAGAERDDIIFFPERRHPQIGLDSPRLKTGRQRERVRDEQEGGEAAPDGEKRPMAPKVRKQSG